MNELRMTRTQTIRAVLTGRAAAVVLLGAYALAGVTATRDKSATFDELVHMLAGHSYWLTNDYRLHPENGNLPQRWVGLPLWVSGVTFPPLTDEHWLTADKWELADVYFHAIGNDVEAMLLRSRIMTAVVGVAAGAMVWFWARRLFGAGGGMIALLLFCLSPTMLAHGALATSDMMTAMFFLAAVGMTWAMMHRVDAWTILGGGAAIAGLLLSKVSGVFVIPMVLIMLLIRLYAAHPLLVSGVRRATVTGWHRQLAALGGAWIVQGLLVLVLVWGAFGFRFEGPNEDRPPTDTYTYDFENVVPERGVGAAVLPLMRRLHVLPDAYLYGAAYVAAHAASRSAFLAGAYSGTGFRHFFPYAVAVKTPLPMLLILIVAVIGGLTARSRRRSATPPDDATVRPHTLYRTTPLWVLLGVYWAVVLTSHLNIGHRHVLPTYLPLFILAGAGALCVKDAGRGARASWSVVIVALLGWTAAESLSIRPHYLAYFNHVVGGPANGYHHLVDSSLDWGQDLPGLRRWIDERRERENDREPIYFSYFGSGDPRYYGIGPERNVMPLPSYFEARERAMLPPLQPGWYCISATMLQRVYTDPAGPWSIEEELEYERARPIIQRIDQVQKNPGDVEKQMTEAAGPGWRDFVKSQDWSRFRRLCDFLSRQPPDDHIGHSILIYHLDDEELNYAIRESWLDSSP